MHTYLCSQVPAAPAKGDSTHWAGLIKLAFLCGSHHSRKCTAGVSLALACRQSWREPWWLGMCQCHRSGRSRSKGKNCLVERIKHLPAPFRELRSGEGNPVQQGCGEVAKSTAAFSPPLSLELSNGNALLPARAPRAGQCEVLTDTEQAPCRSLRSTTFHIHHLSDPVRT